MERNLRPGARFLGLVMTSKPGAGDGNATALDVLQVLSLVDILESNGDVLGKTVQEAIIEQIERAYDPRWQLSHPGLWISIQDIYASIDLSQAAAADGLDSKLEDITKNSQFTGEEAGSDMSDMQADYDTGNNNRTAGLLAESDSSSAALPPAQRKATISKGTSEDEASNVSKKDSHRFGKYRRADELRSPATRFSSACSQSQSHAAAGKRPEAIENENLVVSETKGLGTLFYSAAQPEVENEGSDNGEREDGSYFAVELERAVLYFGG